MSQWNLSSTTVTDAPAGPREAGTPDLQADEDQAGGLLPLRTRITLLVLLGSALCVLFLLWAYYDARHAGITVVAAPAPARNSEATAPSATQAPPGDTPAPATPTAAAQRPTAPTPTAAALAEIEVFATLVRDDPDFSAGRAVTRLQPYIQFPDETVRAAASKVMQPLLADLDARARSAARGAAETAADLADAQDFPAAERTLRQAWETLPHESPWAAQHAVRKLADLLATLAREQTEARAQALAEFEKEWRRAREANAPAPPRLAALLQHRDPLIRQAVAAAQARLEDEWRTKALKRREQDAALRTAWLGFFTRLNAAIAEGDLEAAAKLCQADAQPELVKGGVAEPQQVLQGCAADVAALRKAYDLALTVARAEKRSVSLPLRRGRVEGALDGVEGRQIFVTLGGGARVGVKVENITAAGLLSILDEKALAGANLLGAVWALSAYENAAEAAAFLPKAYANAKQPVPLHWAERFRLEKFQRLDDDATKKLRKVEEELRGGNVEKVRAAFEAVRPALAALEESGGMSEARRAVVAAAGKLLGKAAAARVVLQNGVSPNADYAGLVTDQISQYRESANRTDVGVQYGLKAGAAGGLQRVLVKADGLEAALKAPARVKRATLELYQIDSPQAPGAVLGLFRLKRAWVPDAGTWLSFDGAKNLTWATPGASGDADTEAKEDAKVTLDQKKNVWRSWDVTAYVQEVLTGKTANNGLLLRVINGEPDYHVRFYPETDLESVKDATLRPRLMLETEAQ